MKKTNTYLVVDIQQGGKWYATTIAVSGGDNLVSVLAGFNGLESANICSSKKEADAIADHWNECHKRNGNSIFQAA